MKTLFLILLSLVASKVFCQTNDVMVEEKSSEWIKVTTTAIAPHKQSTTAKRKRDTNNPLTPQQNAKKEFEKTNSQVNRFKKAKKE